MRKLFISSIVLSAMMLVSSMASAANVKVGVIDMRQVAQQSAQHFKRPDFGSDFTELRKQITDKRKQLSTFSGTDTAKTDPKKAKLKTEIKSLNVKMAGLRKEIMAKQTDQRKAFLDQINDTIAKVAKQEKIDFVLNTGSLAFAGNKVDITDKVIQALNKNNPKTTNPKTTVIQ